MPELVGIYHGVDLGAGSVVDGECENDGQAAGIDQNQAGVPFTSRLRIFAVARSESTDRMIRCADHAIFSWPTTGGRAAVLHRRLPR
jgi:hypothetical protein